MKTLIINLIICLSLIMVGCGKVIEADKPEKDVNASNIEEVKLVDNQDVFDLTENIKSKLPIKGLMVECVYQKDDYSNITYFVGNSNELYDKTIQTKIDNIILGADNKFDHIKISYRNGKQGVIIERDIK